MIDQRMVLIQIFTMRVALVGNKITKEYSSFRLSILAFIFALLTKDVLSDV